MTELLAIALGILLAYALYIAVQCTRHDPNGESHLLAAASLPTWTYVFAASGIAVSALGIPDHLRLLSFYGFQRNQLVLGLIIVALTGTLFQRRLTIAARIVGARTVGELFGAYYQSTTIRLYLLLLTFLFAVPFAAAALTEAGHAPAGDHTATCPWYPRLQQSPSFSFSSRPSAAGAPSSMSRPPSRLCSSF